MEEVLIYVGNSGILVVDANTNDPLANWARPDDDVEFADTILQLVTNGFGKYRVRQALVREGVLPQNLLSYTGLDEGLNTLQ